MPRIDLYTTIHKSHRAALFHLAEHAGTTDFADDAAVEALGAELGVLAGRLRAHQRHEDRFVHPLLAERAPELLPHLTGAHEAYDGEIDALEAAFAAAREARTPEAALRLYRALNRFIADNLAHFDEEERGMEVIWARCTDAELAAVVTAFNASRAPAQALADMEAMLPALSHPERARMLGGLRAAMPAEAFAAIRAAATRSLSEPARRRLADALDVTPPA